jgi:transcriptional regulator with PAS, ATPase and Fis domain
MVIPFLEQPAKPAGKQCQSVSPETMRLLFDYSWPGNRRAFLNMIE